MEPYNGFKAERKSGGREVLPAGGYVCQIISAKEETYRWGRVLIVAHDVCEGDYEGIFKRDYENNDREDKKWRGTFRINVPNDDGTDKDAWTRGNFNNFVACVQESNPGYTWNWDEKTLKGKKVGLLYRNEEWAMDGRSGWTTKAAFPESVENVRNGKFKIPKDKPLPESKKVDAAQQFTELDDSDGELPF